MSMKNNNKVGGCAVCHYKIMGCFSDVLSYGGSESNKTKQNMIEMIYELTKNKSGTNNEKPSTTFDMVKYVNDYIGKIKSDNPSVCKDFASIITSYCARLYGLRRSKRKTEELISRMKNETSE